ncbi:hypothetical protein ABW19_dt0209965 [Dactylella cylindrospora]|nr:hypothetical protein ABW19_dt0209965 [Dactylella cylindrospora]
MAALELYMQIGSLVDTNTLATEVLPALWTLALGPLLNIQQFKAFMSTIKRLSNKIEQEQLKKLADTSTADTNSSSIEFGAGVANGTSRNGAPKANVEAEDFEELVFGKKSSDRSRSPDPFSTIPPKATSGPKKDVASFSWSTPSPSTLTPSSAVNPRTQTAGRTSVTPDQSLNTFVTQQKQEAHPTILFGQTRQQAPPAPQTEFSGWAIAPPPSAPAAQPQQPSGFQSSFQIQSQKPAYGGGVGGMGMGQQQQQKPPGMGMNIGMGMGMSMQPLQPLQPTQATKNPAKTGLDAYESLL